MFAIPIAQFCVFYIGVNFNSILLAFKDYDVLTGKFSFTGFDNFSKFLSDLTVGNTLNYAWKNSLKAYCFGYIGTILAICFSFYIFKKKALYNTLRVLLFLPSILSAIVMSIIFRYLSGLVLPAIGLDDYLALPQYQFGMLIFYGIWTGFGSGVLLYSGSMGQVSVDILEAAEVDGAGPFRQFFSIILPSIYPIISTFIVTGIASIFMNQLHLFDFYANGADVHSYTLGYYLFIKVVWSSSGQSEYPYAAAAGIMMTCVAAPLTLLTKYLLEKFGPSED